MKSLSSKALMLLAIGAMGLAACNPLGKLKKNHSAVDYNVKPCPIEMHGDSIEIEVTGKFPPAYFHKKAIVDVTPTLKYNGTEKTFPPKTLVGEMADADGKKISYDKGGSFSYKQKIAYDKDMQTSELHVKAVGRYKTKEVTLGEMKLCDGVNTTPEWVEADDRPILGKDEFVKVIPKSLDAQINYLIQSSVVRGTELNDDDIKALKEWVNEGQEKEWVWKGMKSEAYASPDGEMAKNDQLANDRAATASKAIKNILTRAKVEAAKEDGFYNNMGKGEDWAGFKAAMQKSNIADKATILRILEMYSDLNKREEEIKNLAATYKEIADDVLPGLRRSMLTLTAEEQARSDEEITRLIDAAPDSLSVEEMLYGATLTDDLNKKLAIYQKVASQYPDDWRGPNNVGYIYILQNKISDATKEFKKAKMSDNDNAVVKNNMGVCARLSGNKRGAMDNYSDATSAGKDVYYNMGIVNIMDGDYASAISNFGGENTFNAALAKLLNGDAKGALTTLDNSESKNTAAGYYLKALIGAKQKDKTMVIDNLKNAFGKDATLKGKAAKDVSFIDYFEDAAFKEATN